MRGASTPCCSTRPAAPPAPSAGIRTCCGPRGRATSPASPPCRRGCWTRRRRGGSRAGGWVWAIEAAGADWLHVDVVDGHFVPNITIGPDVVKALRPLVSIPFDVHLMIAPVDPYVEAFRAAGADLISVHPEAGPHLNRTLKLIRSVGAKAGVVFNPSTPPE